MFKGDFFSWLFLVLLGTVLLAFVPGKYRLSAILVIIAGGSAYIYKRGGCFEEIEFIIKNGVSPGPGYCDKINTIRNNSVR